MFCRVLVVLGESECLAGLFSCPPLVGSLGNRSENMKVIWRYSRNCRVLVFLVGGWRFMEVWYLLSGASVVP